jgi:hypothetical protein
MTDVISGAGVYAASCEAYAAAGWTCVIPVPPEAKFPPPGGFTGAGGRDTTAEDRAAWAASQGGYSVALRMPDGVIGIDVDQYVKGTVIKEGAWGPLPPTWSSTARGQGQPARILLFRVPPGRYASVAGPDVEIIQRHHRYAVVAPSPHHETGGFYTWYTPDGTASAVIPRPEDLAELPAVWVQGLAAGASAISPEAATEAEGFALLAHVVDPAEQPCVKMAGAAAAARAQCSAAESGSRHDTMTSHVWELIMLAAEGHPGAGAVLASLQELWGTLTAGEDREAEFRDLITSGACKAASKWGTAPVRADSCLLMNAFRYDPPVPDTGITEDGELPRPIEAPRWWSPFEAIGTEPFDPVAELDAPLGREVLNRTWPVLRYAADAGSWLIRGPERWTARQGDLAKWGVDLVSWMMLPGDPDAPDGSDEHRRAKKRARFATNASSAGIAGKMAAQVAAGHHPSAVELASLDGEREILWAGGTAYDLRLSEGHPEPSRVTDPGTPHLHSAGVVPAAGPTPLWDEFTAAVWPDETLRAWAIRVLSVAFTGYPDKALPILLGDTDRGKTQVIMLMMSVLGSYAHVADARLLAPADRSHASIVYALKGRRMSFIDEAPRTGQLATERLKQITGGADLTGNQMHTNPVTFSPTHTLILTANPNHEPVLTDAAIRRRVRLIPCNGDPAAVRAARAAIGNENGPAWRAEAPAMLARMMSEAARWLADPRSGGNEAAPGTAAMTAHDIMVSQDLVMSWLREECEDWEQGTRSRELYQLFTESCRRMSIHPSAIPTETAWGRRLSELGYVAVSRRDGNYRPLRIRPPRAFGLGPAELSGKSGGATVPGGGFGAGSWTVVEGSGPTVHNGSGAGQTIQPTIRVEGVEGNSTLITQAHTHAHTRAQEKWGSPSTPSDPPQTPPGDAPGSTSVVTLPEPAAAPEDGDSPESPAEPPKPKRKAAVKKPAKPKPDPALEGPLHQLPVIVARNPQAPDAPPLVLPCTLDQAAGLIEAALPALCVDCETTGFPPGHPDYGLRLVQLGDEHVAVVLDPDDEAQALWIRETVSRAAALHAHSAAADLVPLARAGLGDAEEMWAKMTDSVLVTKLGDPTLAGSDENQLKKLAQAVLGSYAVSPVAEQDKNALFKSGGWLVETKPTTPREKSGWAMVRKSCETFARYAGSDVLDLGGVIRVLPRPDERILVREREFQAMCARISHQGYRLDHPHIQAKITEYTAAREAALERVRAACPAITNPSSTKEVPEALAAMGIPLERTGEGNPSAAKGVLEPLANVPGYEHAPLLRDILEYRHDVTTLGLLLEPLNVLCERGAGRMYPVVYTINADTGRTSCVRPNGQQFSRQGGIRACVIADPGMIGISADFSGVEIRVGAALSGDAALLAAELSTRCQACGHDPCDPVSCGKDQKGLHWMAARMAFGPDATKEDRYNCKRIIFSKMFGGGPASGARQVGLPVHVGEAVHRAFEAIAPRFTAWDAEMRAWVKGGNRGFQAYSGRTIHLPPRHRPHAAGNYAIQGTAREFLVDGCLAWKQTRWGHLPILPIHDEIFTFVPAAEAAEASATLIECMRSELYGVPIEAAASEPFFAWPDSS